MPRIGATLTPEELVFVTDAPETDGVVSLIVARHADETRSVLDAGELSVEDGLVGDNWRTRAPGEEKLECQITVMSSRAVAIIAGHDPETWPPAGDQLFVDLDLSEANLPTGTRLHIGNAELEVTAEPHLGCGKFIRRYGIDAQKLVNSPTGRDLRLRGINARVNVGGTVAAGDTVRVVRA